MSGRLATVLSRRRLLMPLLALAALPAVTIGAARGVLLPRRPVASGTSATRCAQCGATDHAMLDLRCPAAPRVL